MNTKPRSTSRHHRPSVPEQPVLSGLTAGLLAFVLAVACAAVWMVRDVGRQVDTLDARLASLETAFHSAVDELPTIEALHNDITRLKQRSDDHDRRREQLRLAMDESQQQMLEEFIIRIVALEQTSDERTRSQYSADENSVRPAEEPADRPNPEDIAAEAVPKPEPEPEPEPEPKPIEEPSVAAPDPSAPPAPILTSAASPKPGPKPVPDLHPDPESDVPAVQTIQSVAPAKQQQAPGNAPWVVNLLSTSTRTEAQRQIDQLSAKGIDAEIHPAVVKNQTWYRIRVAGFMTVSDARQFSRKVTREMGLKGVWVARR